ncbi:hypothetical protein OIU78_000852 [Salix suchowensis]|nr:hypothetical protein OIU78_000852 [Salix suchowensis]
MVAAERRQVDERVRKIIELKDKVCSGTDNNFVVINQKGIDPPSLDLLARAGRGDDSGIISYPPRGCNSKPWDKKGKAFN